MAGSIFGKLYRLSTFGESHGNAIGGIIDGCPSNQEIDFDSIQLALDRRKPGMQSITSSRKESDVVSFLSGFSGNKTLGTPIGFTLPNEDQRSGDYDNLKDVFRPSHADFTWEQKFGIRDVRGGGRASARETACRVVGGAIAEQLLNKKGIQVIAFVSSVGPVKMEFNEETITKEAVYANQVRCPHAQSALKMESFIRDLMTERDTVGGIISCIISGVPAGLGEPVFDKLHADLGKAMLSINAVKGFEVGSGFQAANMKGSEHNDAFLKVDNKIRTNTNFSGGIQGGISNAEHITFQVAFKPVASIGMLQQTVNRQGDKVDLQIEGRHDPCVVPRAVPIVEAMASMVIIDHLLQFNAINNF
jgi:chorismate synthase